MPKNSKRKREETPEEEEETFTVEVITCARVVDGDWQYHVKWAGYDSDEDTWEPAECLAGCSRLLASFWQEVGEDDKDYEEGTELNPTEKWIRKERKRFKTDYDEGNEKKRKEKEKADRRKEKAFAASKAAKKRKQSHGKETPPLPSRSASSTSVPRGTIRKSVPSYSAPLPSTSTLPKKKSVVSEISDSDDDDRPLANLKKRKLSAKAEDDKEVKVSQTDSDKTNASANSSKRTETNNKAPKSASPSRPPTPPILSLFSPSSSLSSSPEISLSSLNPQKASKPKPKVPETKTSTPSIPPLPSKGPDQPKLSVNTERTPSSPSLPFTTKPKPLPLPKPALPSRQRTTSNNAGSASSSTFPSRPFGKPATPTIPSGSKPPTPTIHPVTKPATPTIPSTSKPPTPVIPPSAIPAHVQQRKGSGPSRGVQFLNEPSTVSSGSGLSTKQRLSQTALALAPAKEAPKKSSLSGLSFKKTSSSSGPPPSMASGSAPRIQKPAPPKRKTVDPLFDTDADDPPDIFDMPTGMDEEMESPMSPTILPPALSRRASSQASLNAQADDLLREIMPPKLAAPLTTTVETCESPVPPRPLGFKPKMPATKIQKKWKWTGKLLADVGDKTDHICDVVLSDLFPLLPKGLRINIAMASADSIHLLTFHDLVDMLAFLKTCVDIKDPSSQLARLDPSTDKDAEPLKIVARYMTKKNFVSLVPVFVDEALKGHLLLFPPTLRILIDIFRVPPELDRKSPLVVAIVPWMEFKDSRRPFSLLPSRLKPPVISSADWKKNMLNSKYQLALRILKFPPDLYDWISKSNRPYCIWPPSGESKGSRDRETAYLMSILTECGAKKVSFKADIRAIFVHVGALEHIRKLPLLVERRSQTCSIRFYTYGTHETVHPEHWGVREIYPFGGVVTFTPSAIYEDPWGVINTMKAIDKHPLWTCYILPSVLGMATKLSTPEEDPLAAFDSGVFVLELLLKAIDDGDVSVVRAPPLGRSSRSEPAADWLRDYWITRPLGLRSILEFGLNAFSAKYSNVREAEWTSAIESEISDDLDLMQRQPDIVKLYRRYVVIRAESDETSTADKDGFEWVTNSTFTFKDNSPLQLGIRPAVE